MFSKASSNVCRSRGTVKDVVKLSFYALGRSIAKLVTFVGGLMLFLGGARPALIFIGVVKLAMFE